MGTLFLGPALALGGGGLGAPADVGKALPLTLVAVLLHSSKYLLFHMIVFGLTKTGRF